MSDRAVIDAFMRSLVDRLGGVDATAAVLSARHGVEVHKGTISKRMHGLLDWPLIDIMAIEDAVRDPCVRRWLARSLPNAAGSSLLTACARAELRAAMAS